MPDSDPLSAKRRAQNAEAVRRYRAKRGAIQPTQRYTLSAQEVNDLAIVIAEYVHPNRLNHYRDRPLYDRLCALHGRLLRRLRRLRNAHTIDE
jgi:hypothetical protein